MMAHPDNRYDLFNVPVDPVVLQIPTYFAVIKEPMDLMQVRTKLEADQYKTTTDFAMDARLVFGNAMRFNPAEHWVHQSALFMSKLFEERLRRLEQKVVLERVRQQSHSCDVCQGNTCKLCGEGCLHFTPPALRCQGPCAKLIRRDGGRALGDVPALLQAPHAAGAPAEGGHGCDPGAGGGARGPRLR